MVTDMTISLPLGGAVILTVTNGFSVKLETNNGYTITIESDFWIKGDALAHITASEAGVFSVDAGVFKEKTVRGAAYDNAGLLSIKFEDGTEIAVEADDEFESWQVTGPSGSLIACMPGGDIAIWS